MIQEIKDRREIHVLLDYIHNYPSEMLPYGYYIQFSHSRSELQRDIEEGKNVIFTSQTNACKTENLEKGYKIFVYMLDKKTVVELKLGHIEGCNKEIRKAHNLEKMMIAGIFGKSNINVVVDRHNRAFDKLKKKLEEEK